MQRLSNWAAWLTVILIVILAGLNWSALATPVPVNLLVTDMHLPLGLMLLALTAVLVLLFFVASFANRMGSMMESRKLLKEVQDAHALAEKAEASRMEALRGELSGEFRRLNERLDGLARANTSSMPPPPALPL